MKLLYILLAFLCICTCCCNKKETTKTNEVSNTITIISPVSLSTYYNKSFRYYDEVNPYKTLPIHFEAISGLPIVWKSSIDGIIGEGNNIDVNKLSVGEHTIYANCILDNSTASITITILEAPKEEERTKIKEKKAVYIVNDQGKKLNIDYNNETITDLSTGLMWMKSLDSYTHTWAEALQYANSFAFEGYNDWRLPTIEELSDISHLQGPQTVLHKEFSCDDGACWTSNSHATYPDDAYVVKYTPDVFDKCVAEATFFNKDNKLNIRLVRNIK